MLRRVDFEECCKEDQAALMEFQEFLRVRSLAKTKRQKAAIDLHYDREIRSTYHVGVPLAKEP